MTLRELWLVFRFPAVHAKAECRIDFQRTLRIPDDNREYSLPPGLDRFPVVHVNDYGDKLREASAGMCGLHLKVLAKSAQEYFFLVSTFPSATFARSGSAL